MKLSQRLALAHFLSDLSNDIRWLGCESQLHQKFYSGPEPVKYLCTTQLLLPWQPSIAHHVDLRFASNFPLSQFPLTCFYPEFFYSSFSFYSHPLSKLLISAFSANSNSHGEAVNQPRETCSIKFNTG